MHTNSEKDVDDDDGEEEDEENLTGVTGAQAAPSTAAVAAALDRVPSTAEAGAPQPTPLDLDAGMAEEIALPPLPSLEEVAVLEGTLLRVTTGARVSKLEALFAELMKLVTVWRHAAACGRSEGGTGTELVEVTSFLFCGYGTPPLVSKTQSFDRI
jgi:hypothetical protein